MKATRALQPIFLRELNLSSKTKKHDFLLTGEEGDAILAPLQTIEEKMEKSTFLSRVIPGSLIGRVVLFFFLPLFLLLSTLWVALIEQTALSPYICGLLLFGTVMSCQYRTKGFFVSLFALASIYIFKHTGYSLMEIGLCIAATFDFLVVLLVVKEIKASLAGVIEESKSHMNQFLAKNKELIETEENFSKTQQTLEEEIASWKEEAEQRKVDMQLLLDKTLLIQSEIEMLTAQKESILNDAYEVRKEAKSQLTTLKEQFAEVERAREEVHKRLEATVDVDGLKQEYEERITAVKKEFARQEQEFQEKLKQAYEATANSQELEELQQRLVHQQQEFQEKLKLSSEATANSHELATEGRANSQEIEELQQRLAKTQAKLEQLPDQTQQIALYKQLRSQFEEKARVLVQTRKQLFSAETKLQSYDLQKGLDELRDEREEAQELEEGLSIASIECEALEEEISSLEALISHILSQ